MKHPYLRRSTCFSSQSGFTLVELLVVIAIIAILAGVLAVSAGSAINAAKRAKAGTYANQIQTAIIAYNTEYGVYPVPPGTTTDILYSDNAATTNPSQQGLMFALCGNINASTGTQGVSSTTDVSNTRQIPYLTPKRSDVDTKGVLINPFSTTTAPTYFNIAMDGDYTGIVGDSSPAGGTLPDFNTWTTNTAIKYISSPNGPTQGVAVWGNCDPKSLTPNDGASKAPQFWVHTY